GTSARPARREREHRQVLRIGCDSLRDSWYGTYSSADSGSPESGPPFQQRQGQQTERQKVEHSPDRVGILPLTAQLGPVLRQGRPVRRRLVGREREEEEHGQTQRDTRGCTESESCHARCAPLENGNGDG